VIWADCRGGFAGSIVFADRVRFSGDTLESLKGKRVVVCIHGVKTTKAQVTRAYSEISNRQQGAFDAAVWFVWPAGATPFGWPIASTLMTDRAAEFLADTIRVVMAAGPASIDINAHSLGCPVTMKALTKIGRPVDGVWLMAPAMPRSLSPYRTAIQTRVRRSVNVFYSKKDPILSVLFQIWPPFKPALGAWGESTGGGNLAVNFDCTAEVGTNHTGYRRSNILIQATTNEAESRRREIENLTL